MQLGFKKRVSAVAAALCLVLAAACTTLGERTPRDAFAFANAYCSRLYGDLHRATGKVRDIQYHSVPGLPMLRTSRFLASFHHSGDGWHAEVLGEQNRLARLGLLLEFDNLAHQVRREWLAERRVTRHELAAQLAGCGEALVAELVAAPAQRLSAEISMDVPDMAVPDAYRTSLRVLGLYPLVAPVFRLSVLREQRGYSELAARLTAGVADAPDRFRLYPELAGAVPAPPASIDLVPGQAPPDSAQSAELFARHAPRWLVQSHSIDDLPGRPVITRDGQRSVDTSTPAVYVALTRGRFGEGVTTQLNYVLWFPARPPRSPLDLLAGNLDSLIWRVHLDGGGRAIAYDSIHSCGCWYKIWPAPGYRLSPPAGAYREPVWFGPALGAARPLLGVSSGEHQLAVLDEGLALAAVPAHKLSPLPYVSLKYLASASGTGSLFDTWGFVPGTQRGERWLFWPMGIANPGAMRVLGNQPIAFVGRRHFDDPRLLEELGLTADN